MPVKKSDIYQAREPLQKLLTLPLPAKTAYQLAKFARKVEEEWQAVEAVRNGLVRRFGKPGEGGQVYIDRADTECYGSFLAEMNGLLGQESEIDVEPINLPERVDGKALEIEAATLLALDKFVTVGD